MTRFLPLLFAAALAWPQAADHANTNYRTEEGRAGVAKNLGAEDRARTQEPEKLVAALQLEPGMTVADIGTGVGFMLPYLSSAVTQSGKVIGEDIFPDFLAKARERAKEKGLGNVEFVQGTDRDPKLPAAAVHVALVLDAYHHFDYPAEMLAGLRNGLRPDGRLVIVDFYKNGFRDPKHIRLDEADVGKEIASHGFELVSSGPFIEGRQFIAVFRKK